MYLLNTISTRSPNSHLLSCVTVSEVRPTSGHSKDNRLVCHCLISHHSPLSLILAPCSVAALVASSCASSHQEKGMLLESTSRDWQHWQHSILVGASCP